MFLKEKKQKIVNLFKKLDVLYYLISLVVLVISNWGLYELIVNVKGSKIKFIIFGVILNLVIIYLCVVIYKQKQEIQRNKEKIEFLNESNEGLMELNDTIRSFKHDFYNILQAIDGYIMMNNMEELRKYFDKLLKECNHVKNLEMLTINTINNPAIYGVVLSKYRLAEKNNINMDIDVLMDFSNISEKSYCLSRILGILLDNAIEASLDSEDGHISVQFLQNATDTKKRIIIENSYNQKENIDTTKIFQKEYSTKKIKGNSGLGLWKVRDMITKESKMLLQTTKDTELFRQELEIFV